MPPRPDLGPKPKLGYTQSRIARAAELRLSSKEVAALAVLLASDDARGVTAQAWNVDGGAVQA